MAAISAVLVPGTRRPFTGHRRKTFIIRIEVLYRLGRTFTVVPHSTAVRRSTVDTRHITGEVATETAALAALAFTTDRPVFRCGLVSEELKFWCVVSIGIVAFPNGNAAIFY